MGLKQSIVLVSEYTRKGADGKGSRGSSPKRYVMEYMVRKSATEDLTPVRQYDNEDYVLRYMARRDAVDIAQTVSDVTNGISAVDGYSGIAFGYGSVSLSDAKLRYAASDIQQAFDNGKAVMKTVLSFDDGYLKENGLVDESFEAGARGCYKGNLDQMKLRMSIMNGLSKMSRLYDNLQYVGVIQVDTEHVHCHLCMVDKGVGHLDKHGRQVGYVGETAKRYLRRGIDSYLDENQQVRQMSSNLTQDRRNTLCFIKKFAHKTMEERGLSQFLLSCLPEDTSMWRAGTHRKEMRKANAIVREYVVQVLDEPDSGYKEALHSIEAYVKAREEREGISPEESLKYYRTGQERIVEECMNGVYSVLKQIPKEERTVRTPMLDAMSMDYEEMASQASSDPMIEFGFKLRSYSSRLQHHRKESGRYREAIKVYEKTPDVAPESQALYQFFQFEEEYQEKLMCKYQYFLSFLPDNSEYEDEFEELMAYRDRIDRLEKMNADPSFRRIKPDSAEDYGKRVYHMHGGRYVNSGTHILDRRIEMMKDTYSEKESDFRYRLATHGMSLEQDASGLRVSEKKPYSFDEVKALDIHHLGYDFNYEVRISRNNIDRFVEAANVRFSLYLGARTYLESSGQAQGVASLPGKDVLVMKEMADRLQGEAILSAKRPSSGGKKHNGQTISLDADYIRDMKLAVKATVNAVQLEME